MPKESFFESDDFVFNHMFMESPCDFPLHIHDVYELIFLRKGDVSYMTEGKIYSLTPNSLLITRPLENHAIIINSHQPYERYNILIDEKILSSYICKKIPPNVDIVNCSANALIRDLFKKMDYYCENLDENELKTILVHLTEEVLYNFVLDSKNSNQNAIYTTNSVIQAAIKYIDSNIHIPLGIDDICKELFISRSHLHSLFIKHLKLTPQKYVLSKKLALAQMELRLGHKATDVYLTCGFADYSTFFRAYKKHFGHAPSEEINTDILRKIQS